MSEINTPQSPPTPEQGSAELLGRAISYLSVGYNGLRAALIERRAERATARVEDSAFETQFLDSQLRTVRAVATEAPNHPTPPTEKRALSGQAASHAKARLKSEFGIFDDNQLRDHLVSVGRFGPSEEALLGSLDPEPLRREPGMEPRNRRQRRTEREVAERSARIRDSRKTSERLNKIVRNSGVTSGFLSAIRRIGFNRGVRQAHRRGDIDGFEVQRRQRYRTLQTDRLDHRNPEPLESLTVKRMPHGLHESIHTTEHTAHTSQEALSRAQAQATRDHDKAQTRLAKLNRRSANHRRRQQEARGRLVGSSRPGPRTSGSSPSGYPELHDQDAPPPAEAHWDH